MTRRGDDGRRLCLVPARGGSRRFPRKNLASLCGKPLIAYTIEAARESGLFDAVIVSTDDRETRDVAQKYGAEVPYVRPAHLATDTAGNVDVCLDALARLEEAGHTFDLLACLLPTSPLRTAEDLHGAHARLVNSEGDALMAVTDYPIPPFWALEERDGFLQSHWGRQYMVKSQELPKVCVDNGAIYLARVATFRAEKTFYASRLVGYWMPRERSVDVDEPIDLAMAEFFLTRRPSAPPGARSAPVGG
jgi:pseudaminic acid cytidylyltransferase